MDAHNMLWIMYNVLKGFTDSVICNLIQSLAICHEAMLIESGIFKGFYLATSLERTPRNGKFYMDIQYHLVIEGPEVYL